MLQAPDRKETIKQKEKNSSVILWWNISTIDKQIGMIFHLCFLLFPLWTWSHVGSCGLYPFLCFLPPPFNKHHHPLHAIAYSCAIYFRWQLYSICTIVLPRLDLWSNRPTTLPNFALLVFSETVVTWLFGTDDSVPGVLEISHVSIVVSENKGTNNDLLPRVSQIILIALVTDMTSPPGSSICDYDLVQGHAYVIKKMLEAIEIYKAGANSTDQLNINPCTAGVRTI